MKRFVGLSMLVVFFAVTLGGCACGPKKVEPEPVQAVERTPAPQPLPPVKPAPVKKGRN